MMHYKPHMMTKVRSKKIMAFASGKPCTGRLSSLFPGHKCSGTDTTVGAHLTVGGKGKSTKESDLAVAYLCHHCHAIVDGVDTKRHEYITGLYPLVFAQRLLSALVETHAMLIDEGLIVVPDARLIR